MTSAAGVALPPKNEAPRQPGKAERGTTNFNSSNADTVSILPTGFQFLVARYELLASHVALIATLAFGGRP